MNNAKRMVLVDERVFNSLQTNSWEKPMGSLINDLDTNRQLSWKRPIEQRVKTNLSNQMQQIIQDDTIDDHTKSMIFTQTLNRFLHAGKRVPSDTTDNEQTLIPASNNDLVDLTSRPTSADLINLSGQQSSRHPAELPGFSTTPIKPSTTTKHIKTQKAKKKARKVAVPYSPVKTRSHRKKPNWIES